MALKRPLVALLLPLSSLCLPLAVAGQDAPDPSFGLFSQVDWDDLLDRSPHTRTLDPGRTHLPAATARDRDALAQARGRVVVELRGSYVPLTEGNATVGATHGLGVTTQLGVTLDSIGANEVHVFYTLVRGRDGRDGRSPRVQMAGAMLSLSRGIESRLTGVGAVGVGIINYTSENAGACDLSYCSPDSGGSFPGGHHPTFIAGVALEAAVAARFRVRADIREHFPIGAGDAAGFTGDRRSDVGVGVRYLIS